MTTSSPTTVERRRHVRTQERVLLFLQLEDGRRVRCETVDRSIGGARAVATESVPLGRCEVTSGAGDGEAGRPAEVLASTVDADLGTVEVRLRFLDLPEDPPARRRRPWMVLAAAALAIVVLAAFVVARTAGDDDPAPQASAGAPGAAPARVETADSALTIVVTADPSQTVALSAAGSSVAGDPIEVRIESEPPKVALRIPVVVTIANHGDEALVFDGTLHATVRASRGSTLAAQLELSSTAERLAPGASTSVSGLLVLPSPGTYELQVSVPMDR